MASQADLAKIGSEGFELIEQFYGPPSKFTPKGYPTMRGRRGVEVIPNNYNGHVNREEPVINSKDAAYKYDGVMIVNYPKKTRKSRWGKIFQAFKF